jgi:hypothetical protein
MKQISCVVVVSFCLLLATPGRAATASDASSATAFNFCIATCEGHAACFEETYHYHYLANSVGGQVHVVIVSASVCSGIDTATGATYHMVNAAHVNAWDIVGAGARVCDEINKLVLVGDRGDLLVLHQTIRFEAGGPWVIDTHVNCDNPESVWQMP